MMIHAIAIAVVLQMNNVARAPAADIERAQQVVRGLYHDIGVDVSWEATPRPAPSRLIRVVLVAHEAGDLRGHPNAVMGAAVTTELGTSVAYLFYRQIEAHAQQHNVALPMILASAIAHEVAHLLLPDTRHSPAGLMRACWTRDDFRRADQGQLRFSTEQAALIRIRVGLEPLVERESRHRAGQ
jgi:hypothetical protein